MSNTTMPATEMGFAPTDQEIRVLALDGGGIRGLSSLVVLRELMQRIDPAGHALNPIRPCDYFDLIVGTGSGGLSALFVGRMRMTVDEAIKAYLLMGQKGFKRPAIPWSQRLGRGSVLFDGDSLTAVIGDIALEYVGNRDEPLHEPPQTTGTGDISCRTAILATTSAHASAPPHIFRSYATSRDLASTHAIHEVARATTATTGLFPSISLGSPPLKFIEAGVAGYNNPAEEALNEVERLWPGADITCLVSLGAGLQNIVKVDGTWEGVMKVSRRLVEDCEKVHERLRRRCQMDSLPYFRFNVTTGLDASEIPEWDQETDGVIAAVTEGYMRKADVDGDLCSCVSLLVGKPLGKFQRHLWNLASTVILSTAEARSSSRLLKTVADDALARNVFAWLNAPDSSPNYNAAWEKHQEGTGNWFITGRNFSRWKKKGRGSFLCIYGKPGWGKTVLCSYIINYIANICDQATSCAYAYFFFDGRDAQTTLQRHDSLIRSLIRQFSRKCNGIPAVLVEGYKDGVQQLPTRDLEEILRRILEGFTDAFIIIDSVDECVERVKLLNWIANVSKMQADNVHVLVTTRPEEDIKSSLQTLASITMEEGPANDDIKSYIDSNMNEGRLSEWPEDVRLHIKETLLEKTQGMFRWLAIQLDELQKCLDEEEVYDQLERLPKDLDETYHRILLRIPEQRRTAAKIFLHWTAFSARALRREELGEAAAFEFNHDDAPKYNPRRKLQPRDVLLACAGLIIESEGYVKLSHFSVKEYLISERISRETVSHFAISERLSHSYISRTCLAYLLRFDSLESLSRDTLPNLPLAFYAAENWMFHVRLRGNENGQVVQNLIMKLFESSISLTHWIQLYNPYEPWRGPRTFHSVATVRNPLYYASLLGFADVVRELLAKAPSPHVIHGWQINSKGGHWGNALGAACQRGFVDVVKMLLDRGADINAGNGNALARASYGGHIGVVNTLLDRGADVNAGDGNALEQASFGGRIGVINILLDRGADINAGNGHALEQASFGGRIDIVNMLLDRGADVNAGNGNALESVCRRGFVDVAKVLLDRGADVHAWDSNALVYASEEGHINIINLLLDQGADINAGNGNALALASGRGRIDVVKMLLDRGADVNAGDGKALASASLRGHQAIIKLLLDRGAKASPDVPAS